jgi:hypothetical protein
MMRDTVLMKDGTRKKHICANCIHNGICQWTNNKILLQPIIIWCFYYQEEKKNG